MRGSHNDPTHPIDARPDRRIEEGDQCEAWIEFSKYPLTGGVLERKCLKSATIVTNDGWKLCRDCYRNH